MPNQDEIEQQELLAAHRRTLAHLLTQQAQFSAGHVPAHVANGISEAREGIRQIKATLRASGATITDYPNEEPQPKLVPISHDNQRTEPAKIVTVLGGLAIVALVVVLLVTMRDPSGNTVSGPTAAPAATISPSIERRVTDPTAAPSELGATAMVGAGAILLSDDFDKPSQQFREHDDEYAASKFIDGQFVVAIKAPQFKVPIRIGDYADVAIEFEATIEGRMTSSTGLMFRSQDSDSYYSYYVDSRGRYSLDRVEDKNATRLIDWTSSPAINPAGQSNKLRVVTKGNSIQLYANGVLLRQISDDAFASGKAYLFADSSEEASVTVKFDNLLVQGVT